MRTRKVMFSLAAVLLWSGIAWAAGSKLPPASIGPKTLTGFGGSAGAHEFLRQPGSSWKGDLTGIGAGPTWSLVILDINATGVTGPANRYIYFNLQDADNGSHFKNLGISFRLQATGAGGGTLLQAYQQFTSEGISSHGLNPGELTASDFDLRFDFTKAETGNGWTVTPYFRLAAGSWTPFFDGSFVATVGGIDFNSGKLAVGFDGGADGSVSFSNYYIAGTPSAAYVDDDWAGLPEGTAVQFPGETEYRTIGVDAFASIQDAVDAVAASTVYVAAGTYQEQVRIDKSLDLVGAGAGSTTILAPAKAGRATENANYGSGVRTNDYLVGVFGTGAETVNISGFTLDGNNDAKSSGTPVPPATQFRSQQLTFFNANGTIENNEMIDWQDPAAFGAQGVATLLVGSSTPVTVDVLNNTVAGYQKGGIVAVGSAANVVTIAGNSLTGAGPITTTAQNGIQISGGAVGTIASNEVRDNYYSGPDWCASGILVMSDGVTVRANTLDGNLCDLLVQANNCVIEGNSIAAALDWPFSLLGDGHTVSKNYVNGSPNEGIYVDGINNTLTCNRLTNNGTGLYFDSLSTAGTPNTATGNVIAGNGAGIEASTVGAPPDIDATNNYWGCAAGPGNPGCDSASANVDYSSPASSPPPCATTLSVDPTGADVGDCQVLDCQTISYAVSQASNGCTINVAAGTYTDPLDINGFAGLTINGADKTTVILQPTSVLPLLATSPPPCNNTAKKAAIRVLGSTDVVLQNVTLDMNVVKANYVHGIFYCDSTGTVQNNVVKNLSLPDVAGGYVEIGSDFRGPSYTNLARAQITISGNTFMDTGRIGVVTHEFVDATITGNTFYKTTDDFGYAIEIGGVSTATIEGNTIYGYDTPALSDGSESAGIYIENAFTGTCFTYTTGVVKNVVVENNEIYDGQYGMWIGNGYDCFAGDVDINVTLKVNDIHDNSQAGVLIQDEDKADGSSVTVTFGGNSLTDNGDHGYRIYTEGDGDITVDLTGEYISGHSVAGVALEDTALPSSGSSYDVTLSCSRIEGNATGVQSEVSSVTLTQNAITGNATYGVDGSAITSGSMNAEDNWWGCVSGPGAGGCDAVAGNVDFTPWATSVPPCVNCSDAADCDDGMACNGAETCNLMMQMCQAGVPVDCSYLDDQCNTGVCEEPAGTCMADPLPNGTLCNDGDTCSIPDRCQSGVCIAGGGGDTDGDGVCDADDKCPGFDDDADADGDQVPDDCDNCPADANPGQGDFDNDGLGDACDDAEVAGLSLRKVRTKDAAELGSDSYSVMGELDATPTPDFVSNVDTNGITVIVETTTPPVEVHTFAFPGNNCMERNGSVKCRDAATRSILRLRKRSATLFFKVRITVKHATLAKEPSAAEAPLVVRLQTADSLDRRDAIDACVQTETYYGGVLRCKELP